jgi:hypothetical protein
MPKKADRNQPEIVKALRGIGATIQHLHTVGQGCPDIAVGFRGVTYLIEIKDGEQPPSKRKLTPDEQKWHEAWRGHVGIAETVDDALRLIGAL